MHYTARPRQHIHEGLPPVYCTYATKRGGEVDDGVRRCEGHTSSG
jgi:hypothetical protein